jgi:hypothetical protein
VLRPGPQDAFPGFFKRVLSLKEAKQGGFSVHERTAYVLFMIRVFAVRGGAAAAQLAASRATPTPSSPGRSQE